MNEGAPAHKKESSERTETGVVLQKIAKLPKSVKRLGMGLAGAAALGAVSPQWSEGAEGKGTMRTEQAAKKFTEADYTKAWKALEAHGVKKAPKADALEVYTEALGVSIKLARECTSAGAEVGWRMDKIKNNYGVPDAVLDFASTVKTLQGLIVSVDAFDEALKSFSPQGSMFKPSELSHSRQLLREGEALFTEWEKNKEMFAKRSAARKTFERLERKQLTEGLDKRETDQLKESKRILDERLSQSPEKQSEKEMPRMPSGGTGSISLGLEKVEEESRRVHKESTEGISRALEKFIQDMEELKRKK